LFKAGLIELHAAQQEHGRSPAEDQHRDPYDGLAPKSRAGRHFAAAIGFPSMLEDFVPTIPDYALDIHTMKGKAMGRGLDYFRKKDAKLVPPLTADDPYENEAYRLWQIRQQDGAPAASTQRIPPRRTAPGGPLISTVEKVSAVPRSIAAINPLLISARTTRALLFSLTSRLVSRSRPFLIPCRVGGMIVLPGPMEDLRDATGPLIAAWCAVPDRTSPGTDRRNRCRQPACCRRLDGFTRTERLIPGRANRRFAEMTAVLTGRAGVGGPWREFNHIV
jgi:hypothetical protein